MTKSELIERLASQQSHIPAKAVEDAVKEMLEHMASTLAQGERIEIRGSAAFLCTIEHLAPDVTRKLVIKSNWKVSTFRTLSPGKNYVTAPIFMKGELHDVQPA
ncbi:integration host factor subunit beta [Klebsiella pneumoniae]|uniref:Integration host factor subunit beta n=1 Tax=Klebsiella pneumoniae TaxID=573 RepID=A0A4P0Y1R5_KLEPN|nr:integration host factor subunit beta [Klebsiella pneumoniae]